jgi:YfiH family protein
MTGRAPQWITPEWPAPLGVHALATTRVGGYSEPPFDGLNLGMHVDDDPSIVERNRRWLRETAKLPAEPMWLQQVHGTNVWSGGQTATPPTADASVSKSKGQVCAILTADCLPVLLCDARGTTVAAAHGGWRGLVGGVLEATIAAMTVPASHLMAWLGPAIEQSAFEVGREVVEQFVARNPAHEQAFQPNDRGRWQADIYALARGELRALGVEHIYGGGFRTFADSARFFSYRREKRTGRMATLIWLEDNVEGVRPTVES